VLCNHSAALAGSAAAVLPVSRIYLATHVHAYKTVECIWWYRYRNVQYHITPPPSPWQPCIGDHELESADVRTAQIPL